MSKVRFPYVAAVLLALALVAAARAADAADAADPADDRQQALIEVLQSDAPKATKAITCKQLALCGTAKAVPALAPLLNDPELASWARIPLEVIPDPEADAALRDAMGRVSGRLLIGVINSIGVRRDAGAVEALTARLKDRDAGVAAAAAVALGKIGGPAAANALQTALAGSRPEVRSAAAEGLVLCAEKALEAGNQADAVKWYDLIRQADVPRQRIVEGTRGAILARGSAGLPLLIEQLRADDREMFYIGLRTARELGTPEVTKAVIEELGRLRYSRPPAPKSPVLKSARYGAGDQWVDVTAKLAAAMSNGQLSIVASNDLAGDPAQGQVKSLQVTYTLGDEEKTVTVAENDTLQLGEAGPEDDPRMVPLIYALGDLGHPAALPAVLEAARDGSWRTRVAAVRVLGQIGDASAVPVLVEAAQATGELGQRALESLDKLEGAAVDRAISAGLGQVSGPTKAVLIQVVGSRGIQSAVPQLLEAADSDDGPVRLAALTALGMTVGFDQLDKLIGRLVEPRDAQEAEAAKSALLLACTRMPDRNATTLKLLAAMPGAAVERKVALLELVAAVAGEKALAGMAAAARSDEDALRDAASRLLGEWMSPDAAPVLLDLARTLRDEKYKLRALRGYLRIARQFDVPLDERTAMCGQTLQIAWRPDEKKLALEVLARFPTVEGLSLAVPCVRDAALRPEAGETALAIAAKVLDSNPAAVAAAMKQMIDAGGERSEIDRAKALMDQATRKAGG